MKKATSRILAILLVMVLMVSVVPFAAATDGYSLSISCNNIAVGEKVDAVVTLSKDDEPLDASSVTIDKDSSVENTGDVSISGNSITGTRAGTVTLKATYQPDEGEAITGKTTITVSRRTLEIPTAPAAQTLSVGKDYTVNLFEGVTWYSGENAPTVTLSVKDDNPAVKVSGNKVTAVQMGTATVVASWTAFEQTPYTNEIAADSVEFTVNVNDSSIVCSTKDIALGSSYTLEPSLSGGVPAGATVSYSFEQVSGNGGSVSSSGKITGTSVGEVGVKITANVTGTVTKEFTSTVYVGVYDDIDVTATVSSSTAYIDQKGAFVSLKQENVSKDASKNSLISLLDFTDVKSFSLTAKSVTAGSFSSTSWLVGATSNERFIPTGSGTSKYTYEAYSANECLVGKGTIEISSVSAVGDIEYSTTLTQKVTFDEEDFVEFWEDNAKSTFRSTELSYVVFNLQSSLTGNTRLPQAGDLYRNTTCTSIYKVLTSDKFAPYYTSNMSGYYDLDTVTYMPDSSEKYLTSVTIPFTAYGNKDNDSISGTIVIKFDGGDDIEITSRGVLFGSDSYDIIDSMEAYYKAATGATLNYVKFPSLSASKGKLFYNFSSVLESSAVSSSYEYYIDATGTKLDLEKVAFVPRAGLYGDVTITYTGYDVNGKNEYTGTITFDVQQKTKSAVFTDVTASSYSWAADSVDFLYYEEVANGSNGKYNPAASITRGDFMLMLYRAFLEDEYEDYNVTSNFPDVVKGTSTYSKETYQAVGVAKYLGIAQGSNGKYNPKANITREEAMTLIYRTLDKVGYSMSYTVSTSTSSFSDYSSVSSYAQAAIKDLIGHGVVVGTNGKIQPKSNITRAEMAVILHRVLTY